MSSNPLPETTADELARYWISVDDKLPEDRSLAVLVWSPIYDDIRVASYVTDGNGRNGRWEMTIDGWAPTPIDVSHWMPLPSAPKDQP